MADNDQHPHLFAFVGFHQSANAVEQLASPLARRQEPPASHGDPHRPVQAYAHVESAPHELCQREYPRPDTVLWHLSHSDLMGYLSVTGHRHVQSTPMLMGIVGLGALVEASLLHVHNYSGWCGVLRQVMRLALFDSALLSLAYHIWSLGRDLGDAARGKPHDHTSLDAQSCIGDVVYWGCTGYIATRPSFSSTAHFCV